MIATWCRFFFRSDMRALREQRKKSRPIWRLSYAHMTERQRSAGSGSRETFREFLSILGLGERNHQQYAGFDFTHPHPRPSLAAPIPTLPRVASEGENCAKR